MEIQPHNTGLLYHMKTAHFWFDIGLLIIVWWGALTVDSTLLLFNQIPVALTIKLMGLIALIDVFAFFAMHGLGAKRGLLAQGFIGGFISSTAVFIQLTREQISAVVSSRRLAQGLLLSTCAMLSECLVILYTFTPKQLFAYGWPIALSIIVIILAIVLIPKTPQESTQSSILEKTLTHPIDWIRVTRFLILLIGLMWLIRFLNNSLHLPILWSTFLLSLFEAHAVLASTLLSMNENQGYTNQMGLWLVIMVIFGNTVSKSLFVLRTGNRKLYLYVLSPLFISAFASLLIAAFIL